MKIHTPIFFVDDCTDWNSSGWNYLRSTNNLSKSNSRHCRHLLEMSYKQVNSWNTELKMRRLSEWVSKKNLYLGFWHLAVHFTVYLAAKDKMSRNVNSRICSAKSLHFFVYEICMLYSIQDYFTVWILKKITEKLRN